MSTRPETLPERRSGGSSLTRQWHGAPVWVWVGGGTIGAYLLYRWWKGRSSATTAPAATPSGSGTPSLYAGSTTTAPGTEQVSYPTGGSYSGPVGGAPAGLGGGKPLSTAPATTVTTRATTPAVAGNFAREPQYTPFTYETTVYTPTRTLATALQAITSGKVIVLRTVTTGIPFRVTSVTQLKQIEHTGTFKFTQFTTYQEAPGPTPGATPTAASAAGATRARNIKTTLAKQGYVTG